MEAKSRLDALTGLRFVACLAVAVTHLAACIPGLAPASVADFLKHAGSACIPLFFALSGFVLGYSYRERLRNPTRTAVRDYLIARAARVYPVHFLIFGLCLAFPYSPLSELTTPRLVAQLLLVHIWEPTLAVTASVNGVTWTLAVEVFLYLCLPVMLWVAGRRPASPTRYLWLAGLLIAIQTVLVLSAGRRPSMWAMWAMVFFPMGRLFEFGAGVLLGLAFEGLRTRGWTDPPATRTGIAKATLLEVAAGVLVLAAALAGVRWSSHLPVGGPYTLAAAAVILVLALGRGWVSRVLSVRPLRFLGETSYALYIVHCLVIFHLCRHVTGLSPLALAAVALLAVVAASAVLHVAFERPVRDLIVGLRRKPKAGEVRRPGLLLRIARRLRLPGRAGNVG